MKDLRQPLDSALRTLRHKIRHVTFNNMLYNWSLGGSVPDRLTVTPTDSWPGDAGRGRWLCSGAFSVDDEQLTIHGDCWEPVGVNDAWLSHMHGFEWLRDLRAVGGDEARRQARQMIESWIRRYRFWSDFAWRPDITGRRMASWIALYDFYGASADAAFQEKLFDSLVRQARHLSRALPGDVEDIAALQAIRGLLFAGTGFTGRESWLEQALDLLQQETGKQIRSDGGHVSRNPSKLLGALQIYIDIRSALQEAGYPVPEQITYTIDRMAQAVRFFRYADKKFALFNGSQEGSVTEIDAVLRKANAQGRILSNLPQTGYERVTMGRSLLVMDTGGAPPRPYDRDAHAAPLSFEFMYGKERLFVSCGTHPLDPQWQAMLRGTAAHNTLGIDCRNICEIRDDGHFGRTPRTVMVSRDQTRDAVLLEGSHDGYVPLNGIAHRRRLYLSQQGHDLRGEESLTCSTGLGKSVDVALRFHLHPKVMASLIQNGQEALLRLSGGAGWRFFHSGGHLALEDSVYLGQGSQPRKTKQLVIYGQMDSDFAKIKWALQREGC